METTEKKVYLLEDMRKAARQAYSGISFDPEKRAEMIVKDFSEELESDLSKMPETHKARYTENYRKYLGAWLGSMSRIYSTMIAGPSNFPVRQMEKRNRTERKRSEEFSEWRKRALAAIEKDKLASRSDQEVSNDKWNALKKSITRSAGTIIAIDTGAEGGRGYNRTLFVNSITGLIKRVAEQGDTENVKRALAYVRELSEIAKTKHGSKKDIITAKNSIWELEQVAEVAREQKVDAESRENEIETIGEVQIVSNYKINRVQLIFPDKPSEAVRGQLKKQAFRWSPTEGAWQRHLNPWGVRIAKDFAESLVKKEEVSEAPMMGMSY